jgi:Mrp family chromosome partitioning ATPase
VEEILTAPVLGTVSPAPKGSRLLLFGRHRDRFEDEFALLAADIDHRLRDLSPTAIAVTGAANEQGKTTIAVNLAISLARRGGRVVLVDFDLRRPRIGGVFGIPERATGLLSVMADGSDPMGVVWSCDLDATWPQLAPVNHVARTAAGEAGSGRSVAEAPASSLYVMPSGGTAAVDKAVRMLRTSAVAELVDDLKAHFDWIIFDTPPAAGALEMTVLAEVVDRSIIVVRQGQVSRRALRIIARQAQKWRAQPLGAVVVEVRREAGQGYYGSE